MTASVDQDVELVRALFEQVKQGGLDHVMPRYDEFFTPDLVWTSALVGSIEGSTYRGREEFGRFWRDFSDSFGPADFADMSIETVSPGTLLVLCEMRLRGQGSGVPVGGEWGFVVQVRDGRITEASSHLSHADAKAAANA